MKYRTKDGDVLDAICDAHYGDTPYALADVLDANPGLAARGPVLPSGIVIELPIIAAPVAAPATIRLWD